MPLTEKEKSELLRCSVERVINSSVELISNSVYEEGSYEESRQEINLDDWEVIKPIVCKLWEEKRSELLDITKDN